MAGWIDAILLVVAGGAVLVSFVVGYIGRTRTEAILGASAIQILFRALEFEKGHYQGDRAGLLLTYALVAVALATPFGWLGNVVRVWQRGRKRG
jgi:hypothetical protein